MHSYTGYLKALGPGLLWAATAIGVSHLVQSTRAGASYGFALAGLVVAAMVLKYPLFEAGPRYAIATGESLLEGYRRLGRWAVGLYLLITVGTMFTVLAAVTLVTSSLAMSLFGSGISLAGWSTILLVACAALLVVGRFPVLDGAVKAIIAVLAVSTLAAFALALGSTQPGETAATPEAVIWNAATLAFLVALLGWMPTGIDLAVWHSLWTLARARQTGHTPVWKEARLDFNIGYLGTCLLALVFLALGALIMRPSGVEFAASAGGFSAQLVEIYTTTLGDWSRPVIQIAAFTAMFSTTLAVCDGYPRVFARLWRVFGWRDRGGGSTYWGVLFVLIAGALLQVLYLRERFTTLIDLATTLSFLAAPVLGYLNYRVLVSERVPELLRPPRWWRVLAWVGIVFLAGLGVAYLSGRLLSGL